jgi:hypothetical protein
VPLEFQHCHRFAGKCESDRLSVAQASVDLCSSAAGDLRPTGNRGLTAACHRKRGLLVVTINEVEPPLMPQWRLFREAIRWIIKAYTNESLTMMYEAVRGALAVDDATERQGGEPKFKVRETPGWKKHAAGLEAEMLKRGMMFEVIDWHEGQEPLPFG